MFLLVAWEKPSPAATPGSLSSAALTELERLEVKPLPWLTEVKRGQSVVIRFPMNESTETVDLAWRLDQFWLESTQPPASWRGTRPTRFTLTFRGNTLADIHPRDTRAGYPLYATRSLESLGPQGGALHRPTNWLRANAPRPLRGL